MGWERLLQRRREEGEGEELWVFYVLMMFAVWNENNSRYTNEEQIIHNFLFISIKIQEQAKILFTLEACFPRLDRFPPNWGNTIVTVTATKPNQSWAVIFFPAITWNMSWEKIYYLGQLVRWWALLMHFNLETLLKYPQWTFCDGNTHCTDYFGLQDCHINEFL